jgi:signal transduction histidine kinase
MLRNAFRHAHATHVEVEIQCSQTRGSRDITDCAACENVLH